MDSITFWKGAICLATLASFMQAALALATSNLPLWKASPFTILLVSRAATMSWYFQPTSCPSLPREQNLLPCFSLRTFRADGMTMSFFPHLPLGLKSSHDVLVLPANLMSEPAKGAEPPSVLQPQNLQSRWDDHELLPVVWRGDSLEGLEPL